MYQIFFWRTAHNTHKNELHINAKKIKHILNTLLR
jgi:hypothetical protein